MSSDPLTSTGAGLPTADTNPSTDARVELALQRAAAADAWRGYVESGCVIDRQRRQFIENQFQLALQRERRAGAEIARLNQVESKYLAQLDAQATRIANLESNKWVQRLDKLLRLVGRGILPAPENAEAEQELPQQPAITDAEAATVELQEGGCPTDATKPTVLLITAQAEDNAFGRYALDLAETLAEDCNLIIWQLAEEAPLLPGFQQTSTRYVEHRESGYDYTRARQLILHILDEHPEIDFTLALGKEVKCPLPALAERFVPVLGLLETEAVQEASVYDLEEILFWNTHTLFTSEHAVQAVLRLYPYLHPNSVSATQTGPGPRSLPRISNEAPDMARLPAALRPDADAPFDGLVVGWGPVSWESGVDLFVACADAIRRQAADKRYRYVWLAQGEAEFADPAYHEAVRAQIKLLGLEDQLAILYGPLSTDLPASAASLALFTARRAPLQHTAAQALEHGLPTLAFAGTTPVANSLEAYGLASTCLARPGDTQELANKAVALLRDEHNRQSLSEHLKTLNWHGHYLKAQAQSLIEHGVALKAVASQEKADEVIISQAGTLRPDFMGPVVSNFDQLHCSAARYYLRGAKAGIGSRKPRPGMMPALYAAQNMPANSAEDAYAHYLRAGKPKGPWQHPVILPAKPGHALKTTSVRKVALHIHAYYPEMLQELLERMSHNRIRPDLFVSVKDEACRKRAAELLSIYGGKLAALEIVPNQGRDIGPFLSTFGPTLVRDYEIIGHLHTKGSHHAFQELVNRWRHFLLENTLGGAQSGAMMDNILVQMSAHPEWGIVFPDDPIPQGWDTNKGCAAAISQRMIEGELPEHINFPAGSMFWMRAAALRPFVELGLRYEDYPQEPVPADGTLLHALERLFGVVPRALGMEAAVTTTPGVSR